MRTKHWLVVGLSIVCLLALLRPDEDRSEDDRLDRPAIEQAAALPERSTSLPSGPGQLRPPLPPAGLNPEQLRAASQPARKDMQALLAAIKSATTPEALRWSVYELINRAGGIDAQATSVLLELLRQAKGPDLLATLLWGLGRSQEAGVAAALTEYAKLAPLEPVQQAAVSALGSLATAEAGTGLAELLSSHDEPGTRALAAATLGLSRAGDLLAIAALGRSALSDTSPMVRSKAIDGLATSRGKAVRSALARIARQGVTQGERLRAGDLLARKTQLSRVSAEQAARLLAEPVVRPRVPIKPAH